MGGVGQVGRRWAGACHDLRVPGRSTSAGRNLLTALAMSATDCGGDGAAAACVRLDVRRAVHPSRSATAWRDVGRNESCRLARWCVFGVGPPTARGVVRSLAAPPAGSLQNAIRLTEQGQQQNQQTGVWTNVRVDGTDRGNTSCNGWTSAAGNQVRVFLR